MIEPEVLKQLLDVKPSSEDFEKAMQRLAKESIHTAEDLKFFAERFYRIMERVSEEVIETKPKILIVDDAWHDKAEILLLTRQSENLSDNYVLARPTNCDGVPTNKRHYGWYRQFEHKSKRRNFR